MNKAHFLIRSADLTDRHTEPRGAIKLDTIKYEEVEITVNLISSGNTSNIPDSELLGKIMQLLNKIEF